MPFITMPALSVCYYPVYACEFVKQRDWREEYREIHGQAKREEPFDGNKRGEFC